MRADHRKKEEEEEDNKKDDDDDALANGIERAARFVLVFSAHGHVARHERRRGHVLFASMVVHRRDEERVFLVSVTI